MLITMEPKIQRNLENLHAHEMLLELKTLFAQQAEQELLQTTQNFHSCKQEEGQSVSSYVLKIKGYIDNLERLRHPVTLGLETINELHAMLKLCEQTLPKNNTLDLHAIRAGLRASRNLKPMALSLYVGNGQREAVEAIGVFYLCLPSGLEIVLNNCHYAPSIARGVIFVSRFVIPRDGIFEVDLSNSYANDSSMYAISNKRAKLDLDSTLLWHCYLRHISKKRIKKLQHDGLLNSTNLRAFEKCVSCMSGKMARKPYTHQVERAKDLLGLIHTDSNSLITQEASGSLENLEIIQKEDTHPSTNTSLNHEEDDQEINEPQSDINPIRRSTRTRHPTDLELPPNGKTVSSKRLFKKDTDMDGAVHTYKALLVAKGYTQTPKINYEETFSPVAYIKAIRILIAIAAFYDFEIWQMDVKTAFINGYLFEEVYMEQPE
nr:zinc finger, CCHC-type [Tanacetum cinerariifolium]